MADYSTMTDAELLSAAGTPNYGAMSDAELIALSKPPVHPEPTSLPEERSFGSDVAAAGRRGFWTAQDMIGGAQKAFSSVGGGMYEQGQAVQDLAESKLSNPDNVQGRDRGFVPNTIIKGVEGVSQMAPTLALMAIPVVGKALGTTAAAAMYSGSTYQDTKERMLKQEGLDDTFAAANPDDPRVQKANSTGIATGAAQGFMDAAATAVGGKFITASMPNLGKATAAGMLKALANPASSSAIKFLKGWAVAGLTESITEPVQDETQAYIERQAGLKDAPAFMAQAADSAQGGLGTALLLGPLAGLSHANAYRKSKAIQIALTDPNVDPMLREMAANIVASDLDGTDPVAASNFRTHAADAIGDKTLTGSGPYGLDLSSDELIKSQKVPTPAESSPILDVLTDLVNPNTDSTTVSEAFAAVIDSVDEGLAQPDLSTPLSTPVENLVTDEIATTPVVERQVPAEQAQTPEGVDPLTGEVTNEIAVTDPLDLLKGYKNKEAAVKAVRASGRAETHTTQERSDGQVVIVPKVQESAAPQTVTLGDIAAELTPEQRTAWDAIDAGHQSSVAMYQRQAEISKDPAMMAKKIKGSAMQAAAAKREAAPQFRTAKEVAAAMAREASNYVGKEVSHNGEAAVVVGGGFGKVKLRMADGTEKSVPKGEVGVKLGNESMPAAPAQTEPVPETQVGSQVPALQAETQEVPTGANKPVTFTPEETQQFLNGVPSQYRDARGQAELLGLVDAKIAKLQDDLSFEDEGSDVAVQMQEDIDNAQQTKSMLEQLAAEMKFSSGGAADVSTDRRVGTEDSVRGRGAIAGDAKENKGISTAGDKKAPPDNVAGSAAVSKIKFAGASDEIFFTPAGAVGEIGKVAAVAKLFGKQVFTFDAKDAARAGLKGNAFYTHALYPNTIFIAKNSPQPMLQLLGHELVHSLKNDSPELYAALYKYVHENIKNEKTNKYKESLKNSEAYGALDAEDITEEYLGNVVGHLFGQKSFWEKLARKEPTLFERVLNTVRDMVAKITSTWPGAGQTLKDVNEVEKVTATVFSKYARLYSEGRFSVDVKEQGVKFATSEESDKIKTEGAGSQAMAGVYDGTAVGTIKSLPSDTARGRVVAHIANVKTELEGLGYEVSKVAFEGTGSYQFSVSRDGLPLLQVARAIQAPLTKGGGYTAKLDFAAGLQQTVVGKEFRAVSLGAYNDVMWSELDSLSQLVDSVEVVLLGHGSAAWWAKNIDPKVEQGNTAVINFAPSVKKDLSVRNTAAHAKINKEGAKNEWQPTYAQMDIGAIREEAYDATPVSVIYRSGVADDQKNVQGGVTLKRSGSAQTRASGIDKDSGGYGAEGLAGATEADIDAALSPITVKFLAGEPKAVNDWFKGSGLKNALGDALTTSLRYLMPTDRTIGMALTQAMYKPIYRQLKQYLDLRQKKAGHVQAQMTNAHVAAKLLEKHFTPEQMKEFSKLVFSATEMQLHADGADAGWTAESWAEAGMLEKFGTLKAAQAKLTAQYNKLTPEQKQAHSAMLQQLEKVYLEGREAALAPFKASFPAVYAKAEAYNQAVEAKTPVTAPAQDVAALAATIKHVTDQYPLLRGDYMPLMRFGKYLVRTLEQDENGETGKRTRTEFFDSQSEAIAYAERINANPTNLLHAEVELSKSLGDRGVVNIPAIMVDKLRSAAESSFRKVAEGQLRKSNPNVTQAEVDAFVKDDALKHADALEQLIRDAEALRINMMPRTSTSGNKLQREGVEGYSTNVMKVFASYVSNHANANAGILYGTQIEQAFRDMGNAIKAYRSEPGYDVKGAIEQDTLYKHLYENEKTSSRIKINTLTKTLGKTTFLWYLSSPSIWAVQWSQPFMVTVPKMAARYGYSKALKAYSAAAKRYLHGDFSDEKIFNFNREQEFVGDRIYELISKSSEDGADVKALNRQISDIFGAYTDPKEKRLIILKVLSLQGRIDLSMSHNFQELAASTNSGDAAYDKITKLGAKGMEKAGFFMQHSETGSRRAAAIASFELAFGKDNFIEANNYASDIINDTLFDFDSGNRGKAWQGNTGHILGQFQFFRLHMLGKMLQLGKDAIGGEYKRAVAEATTKEEKDAALAKRDEARKELAYMTGTSMALAGAAGTPLALAFGNSLSSAVLAAIGMLFGDDDDPWDIAKDLENGVRDVLGDTAGNVLLKGLPSLIGMDISKRIGLGGIGNIVMGEPPAGAGATAKANWYAGRLLGPSWGMVSDTMRTGEALAKGDITQAVQYSSPKVLRDFIKASEMADHGVQGGGKTLLKAEDVSPYSYALMMVGINPLEVSLASEESRYLKNLSTSLSQRRSGLIKKLAVATADSDSDAKDSAIEGINSWSAQNPKLRITAQELVSGIKRERNKRSGKLTPKEQMIKSEYGA